MLLTILAILLGAAVAFYILDKIGIGDPQLLLIIRVVVGILFLLLLLGAFGLVPGMAISVV